MSDCDNTGHERHTVGLLRISSEHFFVRCKKCDTYWLGDDEDLSVSDTPIQISVEVRAQYDELVALAPKFTPPSEPNNGVGDWLSEVVLFLYDLDTRFDGENNCMVAGYLSDLEFETVNSVHEKFGMKPLVRRPM